MSTKIHATVDALGNPTGFHLTAGQASDLEGADVLLARTDAQAVIADKAYDAHERVVEPLLRQGKQVVIPSIQTRKTQRGYPGIQGVISRRYEPPFTHPERTQSSGITSEQLGSTHWT